MAVYKLQRVIYYSQTSVLEHFPSRTIYLSTQQPFYADTCMISPVSLGQQRRV